MAKVRQMYLELLRQGWLVDHCKGEEDVTGIVEAGVVDYGKGGGRCTWHC